MISDPCSGVYWFSLLHMFHQKRNIQQMSSGEYDAMSKNAHSLWNDQKRWILEMLVLNNYKIRHCLDTTMRPET